jgi:hypothetical protein
LYDVGPEIGLRGNCGDEPEETLEGSEGEGFTLDDVGEKGDAEVSSNSDCGDIRDDASDGSVINGFTTSLATLTTTSYVFAKSKSGSAYNHIFGSRINRGPSGYAFARSTDSSKLRPLNVGSVRRDFCRSRSL